MLNHILLKEYLHEKSNDLMIIRLLLAFSVAISWVTPALFLKSQGYSDSLIGLIMSITALIGLLVSIISTIILEKVNEYRLFLLSILFPLIFLILLVFYPAGSVYILFLIISAIFSTIRGNSFSIIFKDITKNSEFTKKKV